MDYDDDDDDSKATGYKVVECIHPAQDTDHWRVFRNTAVMNILVP
jgi:hypothetical protein